MSGRPRTGVYVTVACPICGKQFQRLETYVAKAVNPPCCSHACASDMLSRKREEQRLAVIELAGSARFALHHATEKSTPFVAGAALAQLRRALERFDLANSSHPGSAVAPPESAATQNDGGPLLRSGENA